METPVDQSPDLHLQEIEAGDDIPERNRHTHSKPIGETKETKGMPTAWRVVLCVLCLLTVVAVWTVALVPSVLTYSIIRSPVQVMYIHASIRVATVWHYKSACMACI